MKIDRTLRLWTNSLKLIEVSYWPRWSIALLMWMCPVQSNWTHCHWAHTPLSDPINFRAAQDKHHGITGRKTDSWREHSQALGYIRDIILLPLWNLVLPCVLVFVSSVWAHLVQLNFYENDIKTIATCFNERSHPTGWITLFPRNVYPRQTQTECHPVGSIKTAMFVKSHSARQSLQTQTSFIFIFNIFCD